jgi:hypothetical protein
VTGRSPKCVQESGVIQGPRKTVTLPPLQVQAPMRTERDFGQVVSLFLLQTGVFDRSRFWGIRMVQVELFEEFFGIGHVGCWFPGVV